MATALYPSTSLNSPHSSFSSPTLILRKLPLPQLHQHNFPVVFHYLLKIFFLRCRCYWRKTGKTFTAIEFVHQKVFRRILETKYVTLYFSSKLTLSGSTISATQLSSSFVRTFKLRYRKEDVSRERNFYKRTKTAIVLFLRLFISKFRRSSMLNLLLLVENDFFIFIS